MKELIYPVEIADFIRYQEEGTGRKLDAGEMELCTVAVEIINRAYEDGKTDIQSKLYPRKPDELWEEAHVQYSTWTAEKKDSARQFLMALCAHSTDAWIQGNLSIKNRATN